MPPTNKKRKAPRERGLELRGFRHQHERVSSVRPFYGEAARWVPSVHLERSADKSYPAQ
jgi:hypothetical protein